MSEDSTRQRILSHLKTNPPATAREMGFHLGLTFSDVRYHLSLLLQEGRIEIAADQSAPASPHSPGRPARRFTIPLSAHPNNLPALTGLLLQYFLETQSGSPEQAFQKLAESFLSTTPPIQGSISSRITLTMRHLEKMNYQPSWVARQQGPGIQFKNCPYAEIWQTFPNLCAMDRFFLEKLLGNPVALLRNIDPSNHNATVCIFQARLNERKSQP